MRKLFLTWQDKKSRQWFPVGQLISDDKSFRFFYIQGALEAQKEANFQPLVSFPDFRKVYESNELFPMFSNRVMPDSRPEYKQTIEYLSLPEDYNDPLAFLALTGGAKVTDSFEMFCHPKLDDKGEYNLHFFAHGLRYLPECSIERIGRMNSGDKIDLAHAFQNPFEENALQLHTRDNFIVGYCPSYLLDDINEMRRFKDIEVCVERVNDKSAPLQFRLLCRLIFPQMQNYIPFAAKRYESIAYEALLRIESSDISFAQKY